MTIIAKVSNRVGGLRMHATASKMSAVVHELAPDDAVEIVSDLARVGAWVWVKAIEQSKRNGKAVFGYVVKKDLDIPEQKKPEPRPTIIVAEPGPDPYAYPPSRPIETGEPFWAVKLFRSKGDAIAGITVAVIIIGTVLKLFGVW